ncbi:MAG TPA: hypothetical protein VKX25_07750 [Bryobacteraceae bacterium]|jgi:hypothetical protein|nr:hypothetical protein [Bryobacteraceae bacterium]
MKILRTALVPLVLASSLCATTIYTYDFSQGGYQNGPLTGEFTATADASGIISRSQLLSFSLFGGLPLPSPQFFSFLTNGGSSSLAIAWESADGRFGVCVGAPAAFGGNIDGANCGPGQVNGYFFNQNGFVYTTEQLAVVTLVSAVTTTTAPEPEAVGLMVLGIGLVLLTALWARLRSASMVTAVTYVVSHWLAATSLREFPYRRPPVRGRFLRQASGRCFF